MWSKDKQGRRSNGRWDRVPGPGVGAPNVSSNATIPVDVPDIPSPLTVPQLTRRSHLDVIATYEAKIAELNTKMETLTDRMNALTEQMTQHTATPSAPPCFGETNTVWKNPAHNGARETIKNSSTIAEMGYNADTGICEVVFQNHSEDIYRYHMEPFEYEEFRLAPSLGRYFNDYIKGNPLYRTSTH